MMSVVTLAALLIFGFCFGEGIDRAFILFGLIFALAMAGRVPENSSPKEELDS